MITAEHTATERRSTLETARKYKKPKILLVDLGDSVHKRLESMGLNVRKGTFGRPYAVGPQQCREFRVVYPNATLPNMHEQEIVIIDLTEPEPDSSLIDIQEMSPPDVGFCVGPSVHIVNPRGIAMFQVESLVERMLNASGVLVVFLQPPRSETFRLYSFDTLRGRLMPAQDQTELGNFGFCSLIEPSRLHPGLDLGTEVSVTDKGGLLSDVVARYTDSVEFNSTLDPDYPKQFDYTDQPFFIPVLNNKYGKCVGGAIILRPNRGMVVLLPQFTRKADLIADLFRDLLPNTHSHLFPEHEGGRWVHRIEYEHPTVISLQSRVEDIQVEADKRKAELASQVEAERERLSFLHGLLVKSGDALVLDVIKTMSHIGFRDVINADELRGEKAIKEEDIWIRDRSPILLVEVKGLGRLPGETDTHQVTKYLNRRMEGWNRTDVRGVFLVNHQLGIQPPERSNGSVFTQNQISDARSDRVGLMTTWDLFRLIRGMERWNWPHQTVQDVFYQDGWIGIVPSHWTPVGRVVHYFDELSVASVEISGSEPLKRGDTVGYVFPDRFEQEAVESIQVQREPVESVDPGQRAGYKTSLPRRFLPDNTIVYKVRKSP